MVAICFGLILKTQRQIKQSICSARLPFGIKQIRKYTQLYFDRGFRIHGSELGKVSGRSNKNKRGKGNIMSRDQDSASYMIADENWRFLNPTPG